MIIDETNPHYKFAQYWEAIGRPKLEVRVECVDTETWFNLIDGSKWFEISTYRIKDDRHWKLRKEWVDSGYELPIEFKANSGTWHLLSKDFIGWSPYYEYRKAETKQEANMTDKLPELIKGKNLEPIDVPISTLPECLAALAAGHVLEAENGLFHWASSNGFSYMDFNVEKCTVDDFYYQPFIAAYKLVDAPWWENISDGGVLCLYDKGNDIRLVLSVNDELTASIYYGKGGSYTSGHISDYKPVTDEWLKSMMRGF